MTEQPSPRDRHLFGPGPKRVLALDGGGVRGLVALALSIFSGKPARQILETDASAVFESLDLASHLSAQRANGVRSMIDRIRTDARAALTEA